jgi:hypothetical protein
MLLLSQANTYDLRGFVQNYQFRFKEESVFVVFEIISHYEQYLQAKNAK